MFLSRQVEASNVGHLHSLTHSRSSFDRFCCLFYAAMASLTLTGLLLGLTALSTSTPVVRRQDETVPTTTSAPGLQSSIATPIIDGVVQPSGVTDVGKWVSLLKALLARATSHGRIR